MSTELSKTEQALIAAAEPKRDPQGGLSPLFATVEDIVAARVADAHAEVANAFVAWAAKNEIAEPPLDWSWFGEIARRYSPLHEDYGTDAAGPTQDDHS
ncbi:MAG TPA: hypothetical protein VJL80_14600 [Aeromicrobium sp.]|nr:hypothetical protein [Aeromicrobium sp.]HKY59264.1 hypothetical protein [Aeromicrobium sp.]